MSHPFTRHNRVVCETLQRGGYTVMTLRKVVPKVVKCTPLRAVFLTFFTFAIPSLCAKVQKRTKRRFWRFYHFCQECSSGTVVPDTFIPGMTTFAAFRTFSLSSTLRDSVDSVTFSSVRGGLPMAESWS